MAKKIIVLIISSLLIFALAACGSGGKEANGDNKGNGSDGSQVELRMAWWGGQERNDMINELLDAFEEAHPNIIVAREFGNETQFVEKVITQSAGGNTPDVFQASSFYLDDFIERKMYKELDELVASGDINLDDFEEVDVEAGKKKGHQYLIAWGHIVTGVFYNADLFTKAGVTFPENNWSWEEYEKTALEIQEHLGDDAWATEDEGGAYRGLELFALQRGKSLFTEDGLGIDKQDLIDWYTLWDNLRKAGAIPPAAIQTEQGGKSQEQSLLAQGKVSMISTSSNQLKTYQGSTENELNIVSYPWIENAQKDVPLIISGIGMSAHTKHPKEAATLINWLVNDPGAAAIFKGEHGQPPSKKMQEVIKDELSESQHKEYEYIDEMLPMLTSYPVLPTGSTSVQKLIMAENEAIAFGQKSIEKAVDDFFTQAEQILKR
ncbi:ABC transporter substrate-binding protein [Bacillus sp. FJAT-50079]|uniref:ABC transporter substrate-binding protein n=1 Tax=Bacillus sp. FJAT-50079 TaxID=2833577 RepID=UPI001BC95F3F|nr:ABC transporter substrate-binding protein [Bacillus sp. FJAT-50079]MBS4208149.1 carbohydrate ABC transporter substrate-binding protein [Bacillus sp. FJAT-50079]